MKTIRILQMPVRNAKGGITQYALRNWEHIDKDCFTFDWVTLDKKLSFEDKLLAQGCKIFHLSCRQEDDEKLFRAEMETILTSGYDAVHLHTSFWRGFLVEELAVEKGIPKIIVHAHSTGIDNSNASEREKLLKTHEEWKRKFTPDLATHFAACSNSAADFLFGEQIPKESITILRNGIDTHKFEFNNEIRNKIRKQLGVEDKFVLLQSGRLEYQKNCEFTLDFFAEYANLNSDAVLLIVGKGSLETHLKEKAKTLGSKVKFLGYRTDIPELLSCSDVFLQPSYFEGFSIASVEAQCNGIPWFVSESVPEAALPLQKTTLPLHKPMWIDALNEIKKKPARNINAGRQLRELGWDIHDSVKVLEQLYKG